MQLTMAIKTSCTDAMYIITSAYYEMSLRTIFKVISIYTSSLQLDLFVINLFARYPYEY